jgi:hypothetical protein
MQALDPLVSHDYRGYAQVIRPQTPARFQSPADSWLPPPGHRRGPHCRVRCGRYIGKTTWNKTTQLIHPVTSKVEARKNPPELWVTKDVPELRIVSDELWNRVQERLKIVNEKRTRRRIAGCNRAKARPYLFSGLLVCGVCGSSITIGGSQKDGRSATYGCVSARYKRGCTNKLWISGIRRTGAIPEGSIA